MPILKNPKHEAFARELAKGEVADKAYVTAGFKRNRHNAASLARQQHIQTRVSEIVTQRASMADKATEKAIERLSIDREWVLGAMLENALIALGRQKVKLAVIRKGQDLPVEIEITQRDAAAANKAIELLGREFSLFVERKDITHRDGDLERLTDAELRDAFEAEIAALTEADPRTVKARGKSPPGSTRRLN